MSTAITLPTRTQNWKSLAPIPPNSLTYGSQSTLPKLPVPALPSTLAKLRESLKPLARSTEEYETALRKVEELERGVGQVLQERLVKRKEEEGREHWLEEWWDEGAYMGYRESVVINVSYYYGFDRNPLNPNESQVSRAAGLLRSALLFRRRLLQGLIPPDRVKDGPHCMDTWRWMFDACRIPDKPSDWAVSYAHEADLGNKGHVIVLRKGRVWKIPIQNEQGELKSTSEFEQALRYAVENTGKEYPGVGYLTASDRDTWTDDYHLLQRASPSNTSILHAIHSSAFVLCLDSESPSTPIEFSRALWHGGINGGQMGNRWNDKPVQFIVTENGEAGIMGEHSVMDGTPTTRMCDEVLDALYSRDFDHGLSSSSPSSSFKAPAEALDWEITPELETTISKAQEASNALVSSQSLGYHLTSYGKDTIKSFGYSPDSWAQMIVQLAYYRLRTKLFPNEPVLNGGTYEAATTRKFLKGRTEAIRIVTEDVVKWMKVMDDKGVDGQEKRKLFDQAAKKHINDAKEASKGLGIDRHLLGLRMLVKPDEPVPELYTDPLYTRAKYWVLSTSAIFSKHFPVYGWGEVVPDGFGVAYMTGYNDRLQYTITSRKEMPNQEFIEEIATAAEDLKRLFEVDSDAKSHL